MDQVKRYEYEILGNNDNINAIANIVSSKLNPPRLLRQNEGDILVLFLQQYKNYNWSNTSTNMMIKTLALNFLERYHTDRGRKQRQDDTDMIDVHEIMKSHIGTAAQDANPAVADNVDANGNSASAAGSSDATDHIGNINTINSITLVNTIDTVNNITGFLGKHDDSSIQTLLNPQAAWRYNYIMLDSRHRDTSQDVTGQGITTFSWNILANNVTNAEGGVNSVGNVQNIVSIGCGDIRIPYVENAFVNAYHRVTLFISEFSAQSVIAQEGRKYHFIFDSSTDQNMVNCSVLPNHVGEFEFAKPVTQFDTLTISFGCPLEPIVFDMDRMLMSISYTNPATFTSTSGLPHKLQSGDQVYISDFTTNDPNTDNAIITAMNYSNGYNITYIDDYSFSIDSIDLTAVTAPINPYNIVIYFGSKRVFVPLKIKYIAQSGPSNI